MKYKSCGLEKDPSLFYRRDQKTCKEVIMDYTISVGHDEGHLTITVSGEKITLNSWQAAFVIEQLAKFLYEEVSKQ